MKILLTGATGYIGRRLLPVLLQQGHTVMCCVRAGKRFLEDAMLKPQIQVCEVDFLDPDTLVNLTKDIDVAYFLMHSMSSSRTEFEAMEQKIAENFVSYLNTTSARQIIYLSGLVPQDKKLSKHLRSRFTVEQVLRTAKTSLTVLRAGIIVGSGSASFEIIRDLVEKLPILIAPTWLNHRVQPIAIRNVMHYLIGVMGKPVLFDGVYDIGGPDVLTYKEMLLEYAAVRKQKRKIFTVLFMPPKISSYWIYLLTSAPYPLAQSLVESMQSDLVCRDKQLERILNIQPINYREAIRLAFLRIGQNLVLSTWKDAINNPDLYHRVKEYIEVPQYGCYHLKNQIPFAGSDQQVMKNIWSIGGDTGWYYGRAFWKIRGIIDRLVGGVGLRKGRTHPFIIHPGDALDFCRVLLADQKQKRLLLFVEMKIPGEGWIEWTVKTDNNGKNWLHQTVTFRPNGILGRIYWFTLRPIHAHVFSKIAVRIATSSPRQDLDFDTDHLFS